MSLKNVSSELTDADYRDGCGETCRDERRCKCGQGYDERTRAHQVDGVLSSHRLLMAMPSRDDSPDCTRPVPHCVPRDISDVRLECETWIVHHVRRLLSLHGT